VENQTSSEVKLPAPPGGMLLLSPWADLSDSNDQPGSSIFRNERSDFLDAGQLAIQAKTFLGPHGSGASETNRYLEAPDAVHDFLGLEYLDPERSSTLKEIADWIAAQS